MSSKEFDSPSEEDDYVHYNGLDDDGGYDDFDERIDDYRSRRSNRKSKSEVQSIDESQSESKSGGESKSLFEKINLFSKGHDDYSDSNDNFDYHDSNDNLDDAYDDYKSSSPYDDYGSTSSYDYEDDDFDYIEPIREEKPKSRSRKKNTPKKHQFRSSNDFDKLDLDSAVDKPKSAPKKKSKPKKNRDIEDESKPMDEKDSETLIEKESKKKAKEKEEEIEYEDFSDDFFDDGVFGEEGYEALLDDYVKPKAKKKSAKKSSPKSDNPKDPKPYYDFEKKGADSVFNLDD